MAALARELSEAELGRRLFELAAAARARGLDPGGALRRHADGVSEAQAGNAANAAIRRPGLRPERPAGPLLPVPAPPPPDLPPEVLADWWEPFAAHLALERRCSPYTVRNYRQAFADFYRWLDAAGLWARGLAQLGSRDVRDFVIEAQRRYDRRTLHNHVSGLRTFCRFWERRGRLPRNPFAGAPLPKLEKRLPKFLTEEQMKELLAGPLRLLEAGRSTRSRPGGTCLSWSCFTAAACASASWSPSIAATWSWEPASPASGARAARSASVRWGGSHWRCWGASARSSLRRRGRRMRSW